MPQTGGSRGSASAAAERCFSSISPIRSVEPQSQLRQVLLLLLLLLLCHFLQYNRSYRAHACSASKQLQRSDGVELTGSALWDAGLALGSHR
eukprot:SAG31_NODE_36716_length_311_cov_0.688679_1_plen_91_part_10